MDKVEFLNEATCGNQEAARCIALICDALHLWDDIIDKDKALLDEKVSGVFFSLLIELPSNPFYRANFSAMAPILVMAIHHWRLATEAERSKRPAIPLEAAFVLRSSYCDLVVMVAHLCGGSEHAFLIAKKVREFVHSEGYSQYLINLAIETAAREGKANV